MLTENQRAVLLACQSTPYGDWRTYRYLHHPFVILSLERRGLIRPWEPVGFYHGDPMVEATEAGRAALGVTEVPLG